MRVLPFMKLMRTHSSVLMCIDVFFSLIPKSGAECLSLVYVWMPETTEVGK
jgi:hypothetical protein